MANKGHARERQVKKVLEKDGWWVARAAGSLGDADLVASRVKTPPTPTSPGFWGHADLRLIEVKATARGPFHGFGPKDRADLIVAARRAGASAWLVHWPPRGEMRWYSEAEWPMIR